MSRDWLWGLILIGAVILTYLPVWRAGYLWDDDIYLTTNPCIVGPFGLKEIWTTSASDICPLVMSTFWVEHALWGLAPLPYHLVNVVMHGACAVLLWQVLRGLRVPGAWLGAALWALHPVQVESVAWIIEMKNTESALFFLLSIFFFVKWLRTEDLGGRTGVGWNYMLTLLFAAMAMASKSSTVVLPVVLCLCAWWVEGRWQWRNLASVALVFLMSVAAAGVSIWTQGLQLADAPDPQWARSWPERLAAAGDAVWFYLGKLVWPHPLIAIYPRWQIDAGQWFSYLPLLAVVIVLFVLWLKRESSLRPCFFIFAYFLVALLPALGLIDNFIFRHSLVFDHLQYLASMGPLALAGAGLVRMADFVIPGKLPLQSGLCAGLLLVLGFLSWHRASVFQSEETLWTDALAKNPNTWAGHNNLGEALLHKGQTDQAIIEYQKALDINPYDAQAQNNLGNAFLQKGEVDEAIKQYQKAMTISPGYAEARYNLGGAYLQKGQVDAAIRQYQSALAISPDYVEALYNLGNALLQKGQVDAAMTQYRKALKINPNYVDASNNLGSLLLQEGRADEAIEQFQQALKSNPRYANAYNNMGNALLQKGELEAAIAQYEKALEINPNYADARNNLAAARQAAGSK